MHTVTLIAAMDRARAIGRGNAMPWHLPDDFKRFRALTTGKAVVMGRKTFESIGKPLPKRRNIVISRDPRYRAEGTEVAHSLEAALEALEGEVMIAGGGEIYALALPVAQRMHLTFVDTLVPEADAFFPAWPENQWLETAREHHGADDRHAFAFDFVDFERRK